MSVTDFSFTNFFSSIKRRMDSYSQKVTASLEISKPKNHLLVLDGVRAVACLAVLSFHANFLARNYGMWDPFKGIHIRILAYLLAMVMYFGTSGIVLFFLLSGFLLFLPFAKALLFDGQWPSVSRFYLRRIFRIVPGYFVALLLIVLFFHPDFFHAEHRAQLFDFLTFRMGYALSQLVNGPFWTLAVEFQFYMLLPIIAGAFSLLVRRGTLPWRMIKLTCCLFAMLAWGLLSRHWGLSITAPSGQGFLQNAFLVLKPYVFGDSGKYFECFSVGMLIAMLYVYTQHAPDKEVWLKRFQRWSPWMFVTGLTISGFMALGILYAINFNPVTYQKYSPVLTLIDPYIRIFSQLWAQWEPMGEALGFSLCMYALIFGSSRLKRPFEWPVLRWIGMISFSLYMWHLPLIFLYVNAILPQFQGWSGSVKYVGLLAWIVFLIFPVSLTLYRWIEMPGMRAGEICVQGLEKLKKRPSAEVARNKPVQTTLSLPEKMIQESTNDSEETEPRMAAVFTETFRQ